MSITISNCNQICNAPTNASKAKMLYTFPKQPRFLKRKSRMCDRFYDLKNTLSQRGAGFGYGHKYDFTKDLPSSPPPNNYQIKDDLAHQKKGFSFGQSRDAMTATGPLANTFSNKNPGPDNYNIKQIRKQLFYSMSPKIIIKDKEMEAVPGPGQYSTTFSINKQGRYFQAKHRTSCVRDFGKGMGMSQSSITLKRVPGPGAYDISSHHDISPKGKYCLSRSINCLSHSFGSSNQRGDVVFNRTTPGPGNYKTPSEFGHYCDKKFVSKDKENSGDTTPK